MARPTGLAAVGRVAKAHGIRGELAVELLTDAPDAIFAAGARVFAGTAAGAPHPATAGGQATPLALTVAAARDAGDRWLVRFAEVPDRTAAERLRGHFLLVPDDELTAPDEGEVFVHDLVGLDAVHVDGTPLGRVADVYDVPQGLLLEVAHASGPVLVPFVEGIVVATDAAAGRIVLDPPDGLF
ncbi:MAG: ribosome maturation factor RimM [Gemmatimonadaceae bacterium]|jgi:16S rRNA processing protein RimM|nr:ribosome maturation factor RimM [Gemmatimonadaceae bacterium]